MRLLHGPFCVCTLAGRLASRGSAPCPVGPFAGPCRLTGGDVERRVPSHRPLSGLFRPWGDSNPKHPFPPCASHTESALHLGEIACWACPLLASCSGVDSVRGRWGRVRGNAELARWPASRAFANSFANSFVTAPLTRCGALHGLTMGQVKPFARATAPVQHAPFAGENRGPLATTVSPPQTPLTGRDLWLSTKTQTMCIFGFQVATATTTHLCPHTNPCNLCSRRAFDGPGGSRPFSLFPPVAQGLSDPLHAHCLLTVTQSYTLAKAHT